MKKNFIKRNITVNPHFESKCEHCLWYLGNKRCAAFGGKIPDKIWNGTHDNILSSQKVKIKYEPKGVLL
jgi:hypothetical protein